VISQYPVSRTFEFYFRLSSYLEKTPNLISHPGGFSSQLLPLTHDVVLICGHAARDSRCGYCASYIRDALVKNHNGVIKTEEDLRNERETRADGSDGGNNGSVGSEVGSLKE
jgi:hypothetical protein